MNSNLKKVMLMILWMSIAAGIVITIDSFYDLSNAGLAHERMESSKHIGKIMLKVSD